MRVIGGTARGRKLKEPFGESIRPTGDMVKESVFNIVQFDVEGRSVLDLYAGTGQLGIEAISRGASGCVFVDRDPAAAKLVRENVKLCGFSENARILARDAVAFLKGAEKFDLIFVDPPYDTELAAKTLLKIIEFDKLNLNGIIICETRMDTAMPDVPQPYLLRKEYKYGKVRISRYDKVADWELRAEP